MSPKIHMDLDPGFDFLERMLELGPREKESKFAFHKRFASVKAGRHLMYNAWFIHGGYRAEIAKSLQVRIDNLTNDARNVGFTLKMLDEARNDMKLNNLFWKDQQCHL